MSIGLKLTEEDMKYVIDRHNEQVRKNDRLRCWLAVVSLTLIFQSCYLLFLVNGR